MTFTNITTRGREYFLPRSGNRESSGDVTVKPAKHAHDHFFAFGLPLILVTYVLANYAPSFDSRSSLTQYFHGVYSSRVLGRETVVGLANSIGYLCTICGWTSHYDVIIGWSVTNGLSFMVAAHLMYRMVTRSGANSLLLYGVMLMAMTVSASVVTPYDLMSYALIICVLQSSTGGPSWQCAILMVLAVATRESALLIIPIFAITQVEVTHEMASSVSTLLRGVGRTLRKSATLWLLTSVGLTTYVALKLVSLDSGQHPLLVHHVGTSGHVGMKNICGVLIASLMWGVTRWAVKFVSGSAAVASRCNLLWLLAIPYLAICLIWGIWSEAPRLIMPLLIGEFLLAITAPSSDARRLSMPKSTSKRIVGGAGRSRTPVIATK
jgi:hypothetical protein